MDEQREQTEQRLPTRERRALEARFSEQERDDVRRDDVRRDDVDLSYLRTRPLLLTVAELHAARDRVFHAGILDQAIERLETARRFNGILPYEDLADEVELEGHALARELDDLYRRMLSFRDRYTQRNAALNNELFELARTPDEQLESFLAGGARQWPAQPGTATVDTHMTSKEERR